MVNKAAEQLIRTRFGNDAWAQVKATAGVTQDMFLPMQQYPDAVTYDIVSAASTVLGVSADQVLVTFGEYWIEFALDNGYRPLLFSAGKDLFAFLEQLDPMHTRLALSYPNYRPPSFWCSDVSDTAVLLHYRSERDGLASFVVGLVQGLGALFETPVEVTLVEAKATGADHDVFRVVRV